MSHSKRTVYVITITIEFCTIDLKHWKKCSIGFPTGMKAVSANSFKNLLISQSLLIAQFFWIFHSLFLIYLHIEKVTLFNPVDRLNRFQLISLTFSYKSVQTSAINVVTSVVPT